VGALSAQEIHTVILFNDYDEISAIVVMMICTAIDEVRDAVHSTGVLESEFKEWRSTPRNS
jgi:hypothetical protein